MLPVYVGSVKDLISQKKERITNNDTRLILRRKLNASGREQFETDRPAHFEETLRTEKSVALRVTLSTSSWVALRPRSRYVRGI